MNIICNCGGSIILNDEPFDTTFVDTPQGGLYYDLIDGHCEKCGKKCIINKTYQCIEIFKLPND